MLSAKTASEMFLVSWAGIASVGALSSVVRIVLALPDVHPTTSSRGTGGEVTGRGLVRESTSKCGSRSGARRG
ncbi:hypothetical protein PHLGIDRAFT_256292 [Phlebiopsis gigantea 11061_1 CR5-6]|uniref:Uncharacterized protein n=1 Tax=Phlebiopsis gigantea (strain 11061_1 CR5-6) TaxID=745531 RepID=A0A0C3PCZ4_PHLG1|nr:hypothetical protein PHLGIDRAFT_256292 [Phlebiopsis gigantea 11061_1 CR5-6]